MTTMRKFIVAITSTLLFWSLVGVALADHEPPPRDFFRFRIYMAGATDRFFGQFQYERDLQTPTLDAPARWTDGDRVAYRCGWGHLDYRNDGDMDGRVTYVSVGGPFGDGASVVDEYMLEGTRHYDGRLDPNHGTRLQFDPECTQPPSGDGATGVAPHLALPDLSNAQIQNGACAPVGPVDCVAVFYHGPHDIEVRDMADLADTNVSPASGLAIRKTRVNDTGVWFAGYERLADGMWRARVEIRFDLMNPGVVVPGTEHPVEIRDTRVDEDPMPEPEPSPDPTEPVPDGCTITGTSGADSIIGTPGDDVICGLGGNDELRGREGDDVIHGGSGDDAIFGGQDNDACFGGPGVNVFQNCESVG